MANARIRTDQYGQADRTLEYRGLIVLDNLIGGVNQLDQGGVALNEASDAWNIYFTDPEAYGAAAQRRGSTKAIAFAAASKPRMLSKYKTIGSNLYIAVIGASVVKTASTSLSAWSAVGSITHATNAGARCHSVQYGDWLYIANTDTNGVIKKTDGTTYGALTLSGFTGSAGFTKAKYIAMFNDRLFAWNVYDVAGAKWLPSRLYYSDIGTDSVGVFTWQDANFIDIAIEDGQEGTALYAFDNALYIFKNGSTYRLIGTDPTNWVVDEVSTSVGCLSHESVAEAEKFLFWLGETGIYRLDGRKAQPVLISNKVRYFMETVRSRLNALSAPDMPIGRILPAFEQYILFCPYGSSTTVNNAAFVYHYNLDAITFYDNLQVRCAELIDVSYTNRNFYGLMETSGDLHNLFVDGKTTDASVRMPVIFSTAHLGAKDFSSLRWNYAFFHAGWKANLSASVLIESNYGDTLAASRVVAIIQNTEYSTDKGSSPITNYDYSVNLGPTRTKRLRLKFKYTTPATEGSAARLILNRMSFTVAPYQWEAKNEQA